MPSSRTRVADRVGLEDSVRVLCQCGKRLGVIGDNGYGQLDYVMLVPTRHGEPVRADDWRAIHCPRCGKNWEGRKSALWDGYRSARSIGSEILTLP